MSIRQAAPANTIGVPRTSFVKNNFDSLLWNMGYDIIYYHAVECPCKREGSVNLVDCQNCLGLGWVFINPLQTKAIITSINKNTEYKYWSPEFKGTVAATLRDIERLAYMDKLVLKDKTSILSEIRPVRESGAQKFIFTSYPVDSISSIFLFSSSTTALIKLTTAQYSISTSNPYVVKLDAGIIYPAGFNDVVSIDYEHKIQYNVIDIPHDVRDSTKINTNGKNEIVKLPIQAICQKSHYITGESPKYDGTGIKDNSFL